MTGYWLRIEVRRRRRALIVLTLLVALSAATVMTAFAAARRADSALDRLLARTLPATAAVLLNEAGYDWDRVRALPGVEAVGEIVIGSSYTVEGLPPDVPDFPTGAEVMSALERPVVLEGRLADPQRADEVMVTPAFLSGTGRGVGDTVVLRLYAAGAFDSAFALNGPPPDPTGPRIEARIFGVVRSLWFSDPPGSTGAASLRPSSALFEQYRANMPTSINALVLLTGGPDALPAFRADLAALTGRSDIEMFDQREQAAQHQKTIDFESAGLFAFAFAALAAALVLVGQAVTRFAAATVADLGALRAVGMTRREVLLATAAGPALAGAVGAVLAAGLAAGASAWFPVGTPALFEPDPGFDVDVAVLGGGAVLTAVLVAVAAAGSALVTMAAAGRDDQPRRSAVATAAARAGLPVPVVVGMRFALESGRGARSIPVRPALAGAVVGVLGVVAAFTFSAGASDAVANPARFGQTAQIVMYLGDTGVDFGPPPDALLAAVAADPDVQAAMGTKVSVLTSGKTTFTVFTHGSGPTALPTAPPTVLLGGRMPAAPAEVVLAPRTAQKLGASIGSRVDVTGNRASGELVVTGIGFVPEGSHNGYAEGAWLSVGGYDALASGFKYHVGLVAARPGADLDALLDRLTAAVGEVAGPDVVPLEVVQPVAESAQLRNVEALPLVLGAFLALLAVGAVGHALASAVRRRRHDLAVLRAMGMTRTQSYGVVVTQATVLAVVGLTLGVPLGVALGRTVWRVVADITPLHYQAPVAVFALLLTVPLVLVVANMLAVRPLRQVARMRVATVLRAE
ncbi:ABC transporter permease [Pseudonocardia sp. TRM90224]|uniref:ABC transporter permease n=1 Tax=Pseudonocardia sp. TRM90224 TaxID=2812678 RepID=UPI001E4AA156|nr:ABC transporter permease [Pseudonocardia sp. TRM90224]